jgi:hypothetical protein
MKEDQFHELVRSYISRECLYQEGRIICLAQVKEVRWLEARIEASLMLVPKPGFLPYRLTDWEVSCVWTYFLLGKERWSAVCTGLIWKAHFNQTLINEMCELTIAIPTESSNEQRR